MHQQHEPFNDDVVYDREDGKRWLDYYRAAVAGLLLLLLGIGGYYGKTTSDQLATLSAQLAAANIALAGVTPRLVNIETRLTIHDNVIRNHRADIDAMGNRITRLEERTARR